MSVSRILYVHGERRGGDVSAQKMANTYHERRCSYTFYDPENQESRDDRIQEISNGVKHKSIGVGKSCVRRNATWGMGTSGAVRGQCQRA